MQQTIFSKIGSDFFWDGVNLSALAQKVHTPCYLYSQSQLERTLDRAEQALQKHGISLCFAAKANSNLHILSILAKRGLGLEVVSEGEIRRGLIAGFPPAKIFFTGSGKTRAELKFAAGLGLGAIIIEDKSELEQLIGLRPSKPCRLLLRLNPDIDAPTHPKIATGDANSKFGIPPADLEVCYTLISDHPAYFNLKGFHIHVGSQIFDKTVLVAAARALKEEVQRAQTRGFAIEILDCGGGWGFSYQKDESVDFNLYAEALSRELRGRAARLIVELGRSLVADCGVLLCQVVSLKKNAGRTIVVLDAGMNDLLRPALYDAQHRLEILTANTTRMKMDFVGPICETSDTFIRDCDHILPNVGELIAIRDVGAYGFSMSSGYNSRLRPPEVLLNKASYKMIRRRETFADLWQHEEL